MSEHHRTPRREPEIVDLQKRRLARAVHDLEAEPAPDTFDHVDMREVRARYDRYVANVQLLMDHNDALPSRDRDLEFMIVCVNAGLLWYFWWEDYYAHGQRMSDPEYTAFHLGLQECLTVRRDYQRRLRAILRKQGVNVDE